MSSSDTQQTAADAAGSAGSAVRGRGAGSRGVLVIYTGVGGATGTRVVDVFDGARLTIGRANDASVQIESERVSRVHARITRRGDEVTIEDARSRNGTWVNGEQITSPRRLRSGDEIAIGPATMVLSLTSPAHADRRVVSPRRLDEALAAEVGRGKLFHRVFALLMVRVHGDLLDVDAAVDRIAARLRPMDVIAEYAPSEYAIVLPELDAATGSAFAREVLAAARADGASSSRLTIGAGLASFPTHGTTAGALIARARGAIAAVRGGGADAIALPLEEHDPSGTDPIVADPQMRRVFELVRKVADHPITVLISGETGVGKEVVASAIHHASQRRGGPFVRLNCASLPETLLESALFGHEKGAFTGADRRSQGYFEAAHGGTLFLDEIGEISPSTQAKLLRVLESRRFIRVGGTDELEVDVRVICATHRDLEAASRRGDFRSDLFFRISAFTILVPPLRDRAAEIVPLAERFLHETSRGRRAPALSPAAASALQRYAWPGNVRELRNAIERALVLHSGGVIELEDLPDAVREPPRGAAREEPAAGEGPSDGPDTGPGDVREHVAALERAAIISALEASAGNQTEAAKRLGMTRRTLIYRMEKHRLKPPPASRG
jgi:two-component system, NtrC family, response regulator AtoC